MNKFYPYEKQMADKLQQLPAPDEDANWLQMKAMLDKEKPKPGAMGFGNKGGTNIIRTLLVAGTIVLGILLQQYFSNNNVSPNSNNIIGSNNTNNTTSSSTQKNIQENKTGRNKLTNGNGETLKAATAAGNSDTKENNLAASENSINNPDISSNKNISGNIVKKAEANNIIISNKNFGDSKNVAVVKINKNSNLALVVKNANQQPIFYASANGSNINTKAKNNLNKTESVDKNFTGNASVSQNSTRLLQPATVSAESPESLVAGGNPANKLYKPITIAAGNAAKGKSIAVENSSRKEKRDLRRSFKGINTKNEGSDMTFSAGLLLPGSFGIASQQKPAYNINANSQMITDYLPAAYLQYHFNERMFINTELQFQSPQYTNRLLVSQNTQSLTPTSGIQNNIYVEKLYYFNIPLSVHYSLFNNFYIGTGIQYSSLISGVAGHEQIKIDGSNSTISNYSAARFQDDSISKMLSPGDFRWQMDANYYWSRFTMGARYNRALNNVVDVQVGNTHTQARNQTLQLYIRYNIWEERKKKGYFTVDR